MPYAGTCEFGMTGDVVRALMEEQEGMLLDVVSKFDTDPPEETKCQLKLTMVLQDKASIKKRVAESRIFDTRDDLRFAYGLLTHSEDRWTRA